MSLSKAHCSLLCIGLTQVDLSQHELQNIDFDIKIKIKDSYLMLLVFLDLKE